MNGTVREVRASDESAVRRLQSFIPEPSPELLDYGLAMGSLLVTTDESGVPVGYLLVVSGEETHVAELVIDPGYRREGRASALLETLLTRLSADRRVTLTVAPDNQAALSLYREHGFEREEQIPEFFDDGPAVLLAQEV